MKVVNLSVSTKKGSASRSTKPKSVKKGANASEVSSNIVPYKGGLPPINNIVFESIPSPFARAHSTRRSAVA